MKKNVIVKFGGLCMLTLTVLSCRSVDFDETGSEAESEERQFESIEEELQNNENELQSYAVLEELKEIDIPKTIVYVEKPVYYPVEAEDKDSDKPDLYGKDAVKKSTSMAMQTPHEFTQGTMYYDFDPDFTYEIYCQPYRVTDLMLEPGEQVIEMPFLSENQVWEIGAGVSRQNNVDTQHFFLKPAYSGLETSFIIITDRRVYHMMLKSFKDCYMSQVKWNYPSIMPFTVKTQAMQELQDKINRVTNDTAGIDPRYLSFDYKMSYSFFRKPYWLPERVYDDGRRTYILMNETVLHMTTPVLFNERNERINYSVDKDLIILNELIEKVTLRVGNEKVTIRKKNYREPEKIKEKRLQEDSEKPAEDKPLNSAMRNDMQHSSSGTFLHSDDVINEKTENTETESAEKTAG